MGPLILVQFIEVAVGFSAVMLLLSVVVASLSHAIQATLRLRGRNLRYGLASALMATNDKPDRESLVEASEILDRADGALLHRRARPGSMWSGIMGPSVSWLERGELRKALQRKAAEINAVTIPALDSSTIDTAIDDVIAAFDDAERPLRNRFKGVMRGISLGWAIVIAAVFQVSVPDLVGQMTAEFASIDVTPMRHGWTFYTDSSKSPANVVGVLATAILLTLGAPLWYRALVGLTFWRDALGPRTVLRNATRRWRTMP